MTTYSGRLLWDEVGTRWPLAPIKALAAMGTGHTPSRSHPEYWQDCTIPWVTTEDLSSRRDGGLQALLSTRQQISELGVANSAAVVHPADTVMLSRTASVGHVVRIGIPMATTQAFVTWTCGPQLDPRYLVLVLNAMKPEFKRIAYGSTHMTIYMPDLEQLRVPVPPLDKQRRIAGFLDAETARIDALIAAKQRMIEASTERHRAWLSLRLAHGARVPARRLTNLRTSGPRGWADQLTSSGSPFVRSQNLSRESIALRSDAMAYVDPPDTPEAARSRTKAGDVLIGITGANTGWVGLVDLRVTGAYVSQHVAILRPTDDVDPRWLAYSYFSHEGQAQLLGGQYGGTKQQLSLAELADFELRLPDLTTQRKVADAIDRSFTRLSGLTTTLTTQLGLLRERKQALITAAVTGEIEV